MDDHSAAAVGPNDKSEHVATMKLSLANAIDGIDTATISGGTSDEAKLSKPRATSCSCERTAEPKMTEDEESVVTIDITPTDAGISDAGTPSLT